MSDEMIAFLITFAGTAFLILWIPALETLQRCVRDVRATTEKRRRSGVAADPQERS